jgi:hypothetical protein
MNIIPTEPDVNVSAHPALTAQPPPGASIASVRTAPDHDARSHVSAALNAGDGASDVNGFALSKRLLPFPVDLPIKPDSAASLLQLHYRAFITHTGDSVPVPRFGTLALMGLPLELLP